MFALCGCKGTNKRAKSKRKIAFSFVFPSDSTFGAAKGTNKRAKSKRKMYFSLLVSAKISALACAYMHA
jgi:hypothetical protein